MYRFKPLTNVNLGVADMLSKPRYGDEEMLIHTWARITSICGPGDVHDNVHCIDPVRTVDLCLTDDTCEDFAPVILTLPDGDPLFAALELNAIVYITYLDVHFTEDSGNMVVHHFTNSRHITNTIRLYPIGSVPTNAPRRALLLQQWAAAQEEMDTDDNDVEQMADEATKVSFTDQAQV